MEHKDGEVWTVGSDGQDPLVCDVQTVADVELLKKLIQELQLKTVDQAGGCVHII